MCTIRFMGKARKATRCDLCLSTTHKTLECSQAIDEDPDLGQCLKAVELAVITFSANPHASQKPKASTYLKCPSSSIKNGASFATASTGTSAGCVRATTQHQNAPLQQNERIQFQVWGRAPYVGTASSTAIFPICTEKQLQAWQSDCINTGLYT